MVEAVMSVCFSESDLGDWTDDCASLDEVSVRPQLDYGLPTGSDLILLATVPPAGRQLAQHLVHCHQPAAMPRRVREQLLEVTKTVTIMEVVNSPPGKHPRSSEVTVTNVCSDTSHPVSLKISHMHTTQDIDKNEATTQTPSIAVGEQTWDAVSCAPNGTTRIEQEHHTRIERLKPRAQRAHQSAGVTFNLQTDNLIDLQFTQPVLTETHDQQRSAASRSTAASTAAGGGGGTFRKVHTLYYRPFAEYQDSTAPVSGGFGSGADPVPNRHTPPKDRSSVVDEIDLNAMASEASSDGSVIVYADARPLGRASSAEGYFTTIPSKCLDEEEFRKADSESAVDLSKSLKIDIPVREKHNYIVTALSHSQEEERAPTVRWFYADLDSPARRQHEEGYDRQVSRCDMNGNTNSTKVFVHLWDDQKPCTSKANGQAIFNRSCRSEPRDMEEGNSPEAPLKPARNGEFRSLNNADVSISKGRVTDRDYGDDRANGRCCSTPPLMTSTPYTTLEKRDRIHMESDSDGRELRQSQSVPTILDNDPSSASSAHKEIGRMSFTSGDGTHVAPFKRTPTSPIVVVNQSRKESLDLLESGKKSRKSTVTDINWYAAFNMKEPSTPKSSVSFNIDVLKEAEVAGSNSNPLRPIRRRHSEDNALKPCDISMDEIFCSNPGGDSSKECHCNACEMAKLSDEERARLQSLPPPSRSSVPAGAEFTTPRESRKISKPAAISLDDVFAEAGSSYEKTSTSDHRNGGESSEETTSHSFEGLGKSHAKTVENEGRKSFHVQKVSYPLPSTSSENKLNDLLPRQQLRTESVHDIRSPRADGSADNPIPPIRKPRKESRSLDDFNKEGVESLDWLEKLVVGDTPTKKSEAFITLSATATPTNSLATSETEGPVALSPTEQLTEKEPTLDVVRTALEEERHLKDTSLGVSTTLDNSEDWLKSLVEEKKDLTTEATPLRSDPLEKSLEGTSELMHLQEKENKQETTWKKQAEAEVYPPKRRSNDADSEVKAPEFDAPPEEVNPQAVQYSPDRPLINGAVQKESSLFDESSLSTDRYSPTNHVKPKQHNPAMLQLRTGMDVDDVGHHSATSDSTSYSTKSNIAQEQQTDDYRAEKSSDEALVDAVFGEVLDGEASERTSLGAASISQIPNLQGDSAIAMTTEYQKHKLEGKLSYDDWYTATPEEKADGSDVQGYVSDILGHSMDEALFSASKSLKIGKPTKKYLHTDTSFDKKLLQQIRSENHEPDHEIASTASQEGQSMQEEEEDPILKAVFTSSIDNPRLMESVIPYPSSSLNSSRRASSPSTTMATAKTKDDSDDVFFATPPQPNAGEANEAGNTYVSSASMVLNDTHSSSDGDFEDDNIIKLVFSESADRLKKDSVSGIETRKLRVIEPTVEAAEEPSQTPNSSVDSECYKMNDRTTSALIKEKSDEEMLEIESFPDHFCIHGSYSLVINKDDPLGELLKKLHSNASTSLDFSISPKLRRLLFQCLQEKAHPAPDDSNLISTRARNLLADEDPSDSVYMEMSSNRYNAVSNPQGNINFCTAENNVCADELMSKLEVKGFTPNKDHLIHYPPAGGHPSTKTAVADYMTKFIGASITEDELVILPSNTSAYDMLCHCICEAGDVVLTSTPTYAASVRNCGSRAECRIRPVEMNMEAPGLNVENYQKALEASQQKGESVRAVLIINPHNPLGIVFPPEEVIHLCNWATRNNLVVLVDESFTSCVFAPKTPFKSFLRYRLRVENPQNVVYLWSLSKDFGIPGLKISVVQTWSPALLESLSRLELIHPVSALAHDAAVALLSDFDWLQSFNSLKLSRLSEHYNILVKQLNEMNLRFIPAVAGCFVMIDFREHLGSQTFEEELSLWRTLCNQGVMLTPGQHMLCPQPGWMRLVFSCDRRELVEGTMPYNAIADF